jgi:phosphoglycolate phosphatase
MLAANAGTPRVAVSYGAHDVSAFEAHGPLHVAHSTLDLHAWLLENA